MLTRARVKDATVPWGELKVEENEDQVFEDLDNFIKEVKTTYPELKELGFFVSSTLSILHPIKFNKWFRDGLIKEYSKKTGYKITWVEKNVYTIQLKES
jgi:hypothetical protein